MLAPIDRLFGGYIFDLDGTIWMAGHILPGVAEALAGLRALGRHVVFLTNNSDGTRDDFARLLQERGIAAAAEEVVCTSFVMARYLQSRQPGCRCYVIGADPLRSELCRAGLCLSDRPGEIDFVVLGIDRDFTYRKLQTAFLAIRAGAKFVATNPDPYSPSDRGDLADIGALIAAIEVASGHPLDQMVGKPNPLIVDVAVEALGLPRSDCLLVGDQLGTDVRAGQRAGVRTALLLRDEHVLAQLPEWPDPPDYGVEDLGELLSLSSHV